MKVTNNNNYHHHHHNLLFIFIFIFATPLLLLLLLLSILLLTVSALANTTTGNNNLQNAYNQGLVMGRQAGPNGIEDSAPGAVCPTNVDLEGPFCKTMVKGYEDGFTQTCVPAAGYGYECPNKK